MKPAGSLVWLKGLRGRALPQKWPADFQRKKADAKDAPIILKEYELSPGEFAMTIAILEQRYPPPAKDAK